MDTKIELRNSLAKTVLRCKNCGEHISQYGPETFHIDSTMIRCENGETRAEVSDELVGISKAVVQAMSTLSLRGLYLECA